jgi:hypothetical protein
MTFAAFNTQMNFVQTMLIHFTHIDNFLLIKRMMKEIETQILRDHA